MFDKLKEIGLKQFGNEKQAEEFAVGFLKQAAEMATLAEMEGVEKVAGLFSAPGHAFTSADGKTSRPTGYSTGEGQFEFGKSLAGGLGKGVAEGITSAGFGLIGKAIQGAVSKVEDMALYQKFLQALIQAKSINRVVAAAEPAKAMSYAKTIYQFAPHVATDANMLAQLLANAIHGDGVDPNTIKLVTELENRVVQNRGVGGR